MPGAPIRHFEVDPAKLDAIHECMAHYDVGSPDAEWPNNIVSRKTVVYGSGRISRGAPVDHAVDPDELDLCRRLASQAKEIMKGVDVGMGSESGDPFREFFIAANMGEPAPKKIDADLVRSRFGGTIFPPATITAEPLAESGTWWSEVLYDGSESGVEYFVPWRAMIKWFRSQAAFVDSAFVRIGDSEALFVVDKESYPEGTVITGCVLPRLALGLTKNGSLVGLFGFCVQT